MKAEDLIEVKVRGFPSGPRAARFMPTSEAEAVIERGAVHPIKSSPSSSQSADCASLGRTAENCRIVGGLCVKATT